MKTNISVLADNHLILLKLRSIKKMIKINTETKRVVLTKSKDLALFLLKVSSVLEDISLSKHIDTQNTKIYIIQKPDAEIINLNFDYNSVIEIYLFDFIKDSSRTEWELTNEESKNFVNAVHAAYYYLSEKNEPIDLNFKIFYDTYFKDRFKNLE